MFSVFELVLVLFPKLCQSQWTEPKKDLRAVAYSIDDEVHRLCICCYIVVVVVDHIYKIISLHYYKNSADSVDG